ncbi:transposase [Sinorhizobium meliloti]|nr:transposase [Sinorhizobium meliloti]
MNALEQDLRARARQDEVASRLTTIPGIGAICATAMEALAPSAAAFPRAVILRRGSGLRQNRTRPEARSVGKDIENGQRDLRRLLIIGGTTVVRWTRRRGAPAGTWPARMILTKPPKLIAVALANKLARIAWALMARGASTKIRPLALPDAAARSRETSGMW